MEQQLANLITAIWFFIVVFSLFVFMIGAVVIAEFMRRERTSIQADDWMNFGKKEDDS